MRLQTRMPRRSHRLWQSRRWPAAIVPVLLMAQAPAPAAPEASPGNASAAAPRVVTIRGGNHPDFGRLVFDAAASDRYGIAHEANRLRVTFPPGIALAEPLLRPRNVTSLLVAGPVAAITLAPGATIRRYRLGDRIVIDIFDPPRAVTAMPPSTAVGPPPLKEPRPERQDTATAVPASAASGLILPVPENVGAAMFRRGAVSYVVFDTPLDLSLPAQPAHAGPFGFVALSSFPLADATILRIQPTPGQSVALSRDAKGWHVQASIAATPSKPVLPAFSRQQVRFDVPDPGRALTLADPDTGATLLIGTLRRPGHGVDTQRRSADFVIIPAEQGVVVEALSDRALLRADPRGFVLRATGPGLSVTTSVRP